MTTVTAPTPSDAPAWLRAAYVQRAHGVRGELRIEPLGGDAARFGAGLPLRREGGDETYTVRGARPAPGGDDVLLTLAEVTTREAAERLRGAYLLVAASAARSLGDAEWFVHQLVGLRAVTPEGEPLGIVEDVEAYAEHEVLVIRGDNGVRRLPMVRDFVRGVDLTAGVVEVTPWAEEE